MTHPSADPVGNDWGEPSVPPQWTSPSLAPNLLDSGIAPEKLVGTGQTWRPPSVQPGIVALRPLGIGEILDGGIRAIRFNPVVMFGLSSAVVSVAVVISTLLSVYLGGFLNAELSAWFSSLGSEAGSMPLIVTNQLVTGLVFAFVEPVLSGLLIATVSQAVLGEKTTIQQAMAGPRKWWVLGYQMLYSTAVLILILLVSIPVVILLLNQIWIGAIAVILVAGFVNVVASLWLQVRTLFIPAALMLEEQSFWGAIKRGWLLTRGSFWRILGISLLVYIIVYTLGSLLANPGEVAVSLLAITDMTWLMMLVNALNQILLLTVIITYTAATMALLYIDTRMRREGLDLHLSQMGKEQ